jgi:hypothetical protein
MIASRLKQGPLSRAWTLATAVGLGLASAGCTMCPDPFDYSGPVPNGSSPQNDFRARSNGILPLGAAPRPWPLIVKNDGVPDTGPEQDEPTPTLADEDAPADLQQTVAVVGESDEKSGTDGELVADTSGPESPPLQSVPEVVEPTEEPLVDQVDVLPKGADVVIPPALTEPTQPTQPETVVTPVASVPFQTSETPGWRSRRQ